MYNGYESFKKYEVKAESIEYFLDEFYKHSRYKGRGEEYAKNILNNYKETFKKDGYVIIPKHESTRGVVISYYGN